MIQTTDISGADQQVITSINVEYCGYSLRETSGAAAGVVRIHNGTDATGKILDTIHIPTGTSAQAFYPEGLEADGIFFDVVGGTLEGSIRWKS